MLENRSLDNLLGWLYDLANDAPYDIVPSDYDRLRSCTAESGCCSTERLNSLFLRAWR